MVTQFDNVFGGVYMKLASMAVLTGAGIVGGWRQTVALNAGSHPSIRLLKEIGSNLGTVTETQMPATDRAFAVCAHLLVWALYIPYFFLPVFEYNGAVLGWEALVFCLLMPMFWPVIAGQVALWVGAVFLLWQRWRTAAVLGILALAFSLYMFTQVGNAFSGVYMKLASMAVLTGAGIVGAWRRSVALNGSPPIARLLKEIGSILGTAQGPPARWNLISVFTALLGLPVSFVLSMIAQEVWGSPQEVIVTTGGVVFVGIGGCVCIFGFIAGAAAFIRKEQKWGLSLLGLLLNAPLAALGVYILSILISSVLDPLLRF
jgi:hypothetical protein